MFLDMSPTQISRETSGNTKFERVYTLGPGLCQLKGHSFSDHELIQFELIPDSDEGKENPVYKLSRKCDTKLYSGVAYGRRICFDKVS